VFTGTAVAGKEESASLWGLISMSNNSSSSVRHQPYEKERRAEMEISLAVVRLFYIIFCSMLLFAAFLFRLLLLAFKVLQEGRFFSADNRKQASRC